MQENKKSLKLVKSERKTEKAVESALSQSQDVPFTPLSDLTLNSSKWTLCAKVISKYEICEFVNRANMPSQVPSAIPHRS